MQRRQKFTVQKKLMDFTSKIRRVIDDTECKQHKRLRGQPCYVIYGTDNGLYRLGICGKRSRLIYTGDIDPRSLSNKRPKN